MGIDHEKKRVGPGRGKVRKPYIHIVSVACNHSTLGNRNILELHPVVHAELRDFFSCRMMCFSTDFSNGFPTERSHFSMRLCPSGWHPVDEAFQANFSKLIVLKKGEEQQRIGQKSSKKW
mgnify:CR=1 FL=1